jgi:hypothetical protein
MVIPNKNMVVVDYYTYIVVIHGDTWLYHTNTWLIIALVGCKMGWVSPGIFRFSRNDLVVSKPCTPVAHIKIAGIYGCSSH